MKTLSVRDLRQRWPEAEALLQIEHEIIITRDSKPVAKLVRVTAEKKPRRRFDPAAHARWLTELETTVQLHAGWRGGEYQERRYRASQLDAFRAIDPFRFLSSPGTVFQTALRQHRTARTVHCRSLDRLHLAAMEELELRRLMTNDTMQTRGARALGFDVVRPGHP